MTEHQQKQQPSKHVAVHLQAQQPDALTNTPAETHAVIRRAMIDPNRMTTGDVMTLQRTVGNRAVAQLLDRGDNPNVPVRTGESLVQRAAGGFVSNSRQANSSGSSAAHAAKSVHLPGSQGGQPLVAHEVTHVGQKVSGMVQRDDEIVPMEEYGDIKLPNWFQEQWQKRQGKKGKTTGREQRRKAIPQGRMKPKESRALTKTWLRARELPGDIRQQTDDLGDLYAHAQMLKGSYDHTLQSVAELTNGTYKAVPIKTIGRAMDKVTTDYTNKETGEQRPELVKDLLRSAIVYETASDMANGVILLKTLKNETPTMKIVKFKNNFKPSGTGGIKGYGDINMSLSVGNEFIAELQLHLAKFWELKDTHTDHDRYEKISQLKRAKEKKRDKRLGRRDQHKLSQLEQEHAQTYIDAFDTLDNPQQAITELSSLTA